MYSNFERRTHAGLEKRDDGDSGGGWGPLQIMAPVLAGLGVAILFAGFYLWWYRKHNPSSKETMPKGVRPNRRFFGLFPSVSHVREANRSTTWTIDPNDIEGSSQGHNRLPSSPTGELNFANLKQHQQSAPSSPQSSPTSTLSSAWNRFLYAIPVPWKRRRVPVKAIRPSRGFRIDETDRRTSTAPSRPSIAVSYNDDDQPPTDQWKYIPQPQAASNSTGSRTGADNIFPGQDPDDDSDTDSVGVPEPEEEHTSLLSASSRMGHSVMLISRNGENFTLESGDSQGSRGVRGGGGPALNIVPPSPMRPPQPEAVNRPFLPPPPNYPAPSPSNTPRPPANGPPVLPTLQETITLKSPPPSLRPTNASAYSLAPSLGQTPQHQRNASASEQPANVWSPPPHLASSSSTTSLRQAGADTRYVEHTLRSPPLQARALLEEPSSNQMDGRILLNGVSSTSNLPQSLYPSHSLRSHISRRSPSPSGPRQHHPNSPYAPMRQLSSDSNSGNQTHMRNPSADYLARPDRSDPVMLFPGSVRAAGYNPNSRPNSPQPPPTDTDSLYSQGSYPRLPPGTHSRTNSKA